ncbi:MAG: YbbR-like domain-containing protein, partial [Proteobacteria bacterium]
TKGKIREGYQVSELKLEPSRVLLTGPESQLATVTKIPTAVIDLSEIDASKPTDIELPLDDWTGVRLISAKPKLVASLQVIQANFRLRGIPIEVQSTHQARVDQDQVTVYVRAAADRMKDLRDGSIVAKLNVVDKNKGRYREKVQVILPPGVSLVRVVPDYVRVTLY